MPDLGTDSPLAEWLQLSESLQRGLVHALNNRITALSAFAELAAMGDEELTAERVLPGELARLQQVNAHFRLLLTEVSAPEALEVAPVLEDAIALHQHHPGLRAQQCELSRASGLMPVRAPRGAVLRLTLFFVEAAKRAGESRGDAVTVVRLEGDERELVLSAPGRAEVGRYPVALAALCGGRLTLEADGLRLVLPTLLEIRRRERENSGRS